MSGKSLTEERVTLGADLKLVREENNLLLGDIATRTGHNKEIDGVKSSHECKIEDLAEGLKATTARLNLLMANCVKQQT